MVFKGTSNNVNSARAMTLIEVLIAGAITAVLSTAICTSLVFSSRSLVGVSNYVEMDGRSRNSLDHLMSDIRDLQRVVSLTSNATTATLRGQRWSNDVEIIYIWNKADTTLRRQCEDESKLLLTNCESLTFDMFTRSLQPGGTLVRTAVPNQCKYLQVSWTCQKSIGSTEDEMWNTETVQTAGIMLRNHH